MPPQFSPLPPAASASLALAAPRPSCSPRPWSLLLLAPLPWQATLPCCSYTQSRSAGVGASAPAAATLWETQWLSFLFCHLPKSWWGKVGGCSAVSDIYSSAVAVNTLHVMPIVTCLLLPLCQSNPYSHCHKHWQAQFSLTHTKIQCHNMKIQCHLNHWNKNFMATLKKSVKVSQSQFPQKGTARHWKA